MSIEKVKWYEELRDYIIENWETILTYGFMAFLIIVLTSKGWCIQQCLGRYCGIPTRDQVGECFKECSVPEFLANPVFPTIMIYVFIMSIIIPVISIIRKVIE